MSPCQIQCLYMTLEKGIISNAYIRCTFYKMFNTNCICSCAVQTVIIPRLLKYVLELHLILLPSDLVAPDFVALLLVYLNIQYHYIRWLGPETECVPSLLLLTLVLVS